MEVRKLLTTLFLISFVALLAYTQDMKQLNPESLFLTDSGVNKYEEFHNKFPEKQVLIVTQDVLITNKETYTQFLKLSEFVKSKCPKKCSVLEPHKFSKDKTSFIKELQDQKNKKVDSIKLFGKKFYSIYITQTNNNFKKIITELESYKSPLSFAGHPYTNFILDRSALVVQTRLFPFMFAASFLLILLIVRSIKTSLIVYFPALFSALLSLGVIKLYFSSMNMITSIVPLMSFTINLSLAFHLYFTLTQSKSIEAAIREKFKPIALMMITTVIGFWSLSISEIMAIRTFGLLTGAMILVTSSLNLGWFLLNDRYLKNVTFSSSTSLKFLSKYLKQTLSSKVIILILVSSVSLGFFGLKNAQVITDANEYFYGANTSSTSSTIINQIGGVPILEIGIKLDSKKSYFDSMRELSLIEDQIIKNHKVKILSLNQVIKNINYKYSGNHSLPANRFAYTALHSKVPKTIKKNIQKNGNLYKITILGKQQNVDKYSIKIEGIRKEVKSLTYEFNGLYYNLMISQREMIYTLAKSFIIGLLVMSIIAFSINSSFSFLLSFITINILPVGISLFFLNIFGMSLNIATIMTYSVGLGIVVDSTFHIHHALSRKDMNYSKFIQTTALPIFTSTIVLIISFLFFTFYNFMPIREFGLNLAVIVFLGMIFDLYVLPTLILKNHKLQEVLDEQDI